MFMRIKNQIPRGLVLLVAVAFLGFMVCSPVSLNAPSSIARGNDLYVSASSCSPNITITIEDGNGNTVYDSDADSSSEEETNPGGSQYSRSIVYHVPLNATGPFTVTATDGNGNSTSTSVVVYWPGKEMSS